MDIETIPRAIEIVGGFPRADWAIIAAQVEKEIIQRTGGRAGPVSERDFITSTVDCQRQWMRRMQRHLGGEYRVHEFQGVLYLTEQPEREASQLAEFIEHGLMIIDDCLEAASAKKRFGKLLTIGFTDDDDYADYIGHTYPDRSHTMKNATRMAGASWGQMRQGRDLRGLAGTQLIIEQPKRRELRAIAHELSHIGLEHLSLPAWLSEGTAEVLLRMVMVEPPLKLTPASWGQHQSYWNYRGLGEFWKGDWVDHPGEETRLSSELAELIVRAMNKTDESRFNYFLLNAQPADVGRGAAEKWLGNPLNHFAGMVLGEGPWADKS